MSDPVLSPWRRIGRFVKWSSMLLASLAMCIALVLLAFIVLMGWPSHDEVARVPGPGELDALVLEENGGATTSFWYDVFVVPRSGKARWWRKAAHIYGAGRNERAFGVNVRWADAGHIVVEYLTADDARVIRPSLEVKGQRVAVTLHSGVRDPSAPPGGMLYNLRHKS